MTKIVFIMPGNLMEGRGSERVLFSYLKYIPTNYHATILQNNIFSNSRIDENKIKDYTNMAEVLTYKASGNAENYRKIYGNYTKIQLIKNIFISLLKNPFKMDERNIKKNTSIYNKISDADVVYLFSNNHAILFRTINAKIIMGSNHIFNINQLNYKGMKRMYIRIFDRYFYKYTNGFHFFPQNIQYKNKLNKKYNLSLPAGIDTDIFHPANDRITGDKIKVLFVAALKPEKGLDILLPLIKKYGNDSMFEFHIAGNGPLEEEVKKISSVRYYNSLSDLELAELYRNMDIFIYPSHNDSLSLVVIQAFASGLFVLCSEYLSGNFDEFNGKYMKYIKNSIDSYYDALNQIASNRQLLSYNREQEYKMVKEKYDEKMIAKELYRKIDEMLSKNFS